VKYAVVDIETTGGSPKKDKITEIAIMIFDGERRVDEFVSLVNPECQVPYHISRMTGITNNMVSSAPRFYEIAEKIVKITEDCIFVGHNVQFDYNFVKEEFRSLGYHYHRDTMCTVQMSRKYIPGKKSYSLGNICADLCIGISGRHRAAGDALATVELMKYMQSHGNGIFEGKLVSAGLKKIPSNWHPEVDLKSIDAIPDTIGVYYLLDEKNEIIYIGKSVHIRSRIYEHLRNTGKRRSCEMSSKIYTAGYESTGNELMALILESAEIMKHKPLYNRAGRGNPFTWCITTKTNKDGYITFRATSKPGDDEEIVTGFEKRERAYEYLDLVIYDYGLCQKLSGRHTGKGACFHFSINRCRGACTGIESPETYNERANKFLESDTFEHNDFYLFLTGRHDKENAIIKFKGGRFCGFGFYNKGDSLDLHDLDSNLTFIPETRYIRNVIRSFMKENDYKVMRYKSVHEE